MRRAAALSPRRRRARVARRLDCGDVTHRRPVLLGTPAPTHEPWTITNARLFDSGDGRVRDGVSISIRDGRVVEIREGAGAPSDEHGRVVDAQGRTVIPGLIDVHAHLNVSTPPFDPGTEPERPGLRAHLLGAGLRRTLAMGVTTVRDVGSYGDAVFDARQAMRYGAFRGPRVLTCGRIISPTAPGGRFFDGMYREADGPEEMRKAVREQVREGADFVKIMATGARSVELEDPEPAQVTQPEMHALVDEAHRLGYRVAAHAEGLAGTELAILEGVDTIEHGMYLNQRPDLLDHMASNGQILVPTLGCFYGVAALGDAVGLDGERSVETSFRSDRENWTPMLKQLAEHNLEQAAETLAAARSAGVEIAAGHDWYPFEGISLEVVRLAHHGLTNAEALAAATRTSARAAGLDEHAGQVKAGMLADLVLVDGDPLHDPALLCHARNLWLVVHNGTPAAGTVTMGQVSG